MKHSKSGLFLMELIIVLLFFSLASTVCVRLFVKSGTLSEDTVDLTYAVSQAQNLAEAYLACDGDIIQVHFLFPKSEIIEDDLLVVEDDGYTSTISFSPEDKNGLIHGDIVIYNAAEEELYSLQVVHYIPERRGAHE